MPTQKRPYIFSVPSVGDNVSFSLLVPKGYCYRMTEIRVVRNSEFLEAKLVVNSASRTLEMMGMPVFSALLSLGKVGGSVISVVPQEAFFTDGDQIYGTTYGMSPNDKMCFVGELVKNEN